MSNSFVTIARVVKPQGRLGEVAAEIHTQFPERFAERKRVVLLDPAGHRREADVEDHWFHKDRVILKFAGVDSIDDAAQLKGHEVQIPASERSPLDEDEIYVSDLQGCSVFAGAQEIGSIQDVEFGAGEVPLLIIRAGAKEYMIPFAKAYLKSVDLAGRRIEMELPEGMLELDAPLSREEKQRQQG